MSRSINDVIAEVRSACYRTMRLYLEHYNVEDAESIAKRYLDSIYFDPSYQAFQYLITSDEENNEDEMDRLEGLDDWSCGFISDTSTFYQHY